jgi:hypothetical protein
MDVTTTTPHAPTTSREVRQRLVEALRLDLVGPWVGHAQERERLYFRDRPATFYLTGFLVPEAARAPKRVAASLDATERERALAGEVDGDGDFTGSATGHSVYAEEAQADAVPWKPRLRPASMGLSILMPPTTDATDEGLTVVVRWGDYQKIEAPGDDPENRRRPPGGQTPPATRRLRAGQVDELEDDEDEAPDVAEPGVTGPMCWQRTPHTGLVEVPLREVSTSTVWTRPVPSSNGLEVKVASHAFTAADAHAGMPAGTRSVSIFLTNGRAFNDGKWIDEVSAFQAELEVRSSVALVPRPDLKGARSKAWDDSVNALHYADVREYATGHGVSADWDIVPDGPNGAATCHVVRTTWLPGASVPRVEPAQIDGVTVRMAALADLPHGDAVRAALGALPTAYRHWIEAEGRLAAADASFSAAQRETAEQLMAQAGIAADRIAGGIDLLATDPVAREAFCVANRAVAAALVQVGVLDPAWRPFQLAFIVLNVVGMTDRTDPSRKVVDLLFFPTGGGKTEAYLGLAAYAMVLRRRRNPGHGGRDGAGVAVLMRYSLRLLTLDQLARATRLVCALELIRKGDVARYGEWPFEIGLWVGSASTPNRMGRRPGDVGEETAIGKLERFQTQAGRAPRPVPIEECPWCGHPLDNQSFGVVPDKTAPLHLEIGCAATACAFTRAAGGLPIVAVDETIYRRLPAFIVATLDKFANLPWIGQSGALLGGADRYDTHGFYGPTERNKGSQLLGALLPPDLIIQDELHLVGGPLGTMAGLYETAIEGLCLREEGGTTVRPKIVASTATVRQARNQVEALFGRSKTAIFPPPGPNRNDSFFARTIPASEATPGRDYLGIAAPAGNAKATMRRVWLALLGAAMLAYRDAKRAAEAAGTPHRVGENPADPYLTVLGYFNSLRELGGARRVLEEEVQNTVRRYGTRRRRTEAASSFLSRKFLRAVVELTSRERTSDVAKARRRLGLSFDDASNRVDMAIATNMISVGLDIPRLGLMVVHGQPIQTAEYIQATSRVGRDRAKPGLVVTILNPNKPRDRSHYERFRHFHETFYRSVEPVSVTPFASRALDRGLAGALVAAIRHGNPLLTGAADVVNMPAVRDADEQRVMRWFVDRVGRQQFPKDLGEQRADDVRKRIGALLDGWSRVITYYREAKLRYQRYEGAAPAGTRPLLQDVLETNFESDEFMFRAGRSLRDVEPQMDFAVEDLSGGRVADGVA